MLNELMKRANLNKKELAELVGVSPRTVYNWCKEDKVPSHYVIQKLVDYIEKVETNKITDEMVAETLDRLDKIRKVSK